MLFENRNFFAIILFRGVIFRKFFMKKIFLICFCAAVYAGFSFMPVFSVQSDDVKNEVNRVKLEAKQKVEQIKAEARAAKMKAEADAKQAKIDAKNAKINAAKEAKKAAKTAEFNAKMADIKAKHDAERAAVIEAAAAKKSKTDAIANVKLSKIEEKSNRAITALRIKYEGKDPENTVKAEKIANKKTKTKQENNIEPDNKILPVSELKPHTVKETEKPPVINYAHNYEEMDFETKKAEIVSVLELTDEQQVKAEKIYTKAIEKIAALNNQINDKHQEAKMVKLSKIDTKTQLARLVKLNEELDILYYKRDKIHNDGLKKFEKILNKEQKKIWHDIKIRGTRFFPPIDEIKSDIKTPPEN